VLHVLSTAGASVLAVGYAIPMIYFAWSLRYGKIAAPTRGALPAWSGKQLAAAAPQFRHDAVVTQDAYDYSTVVGEAVESWLARYRCSSTPKPSRRTPRRWGCGLSHHRSHVLRRHVHGLHGLPPSVFGRVRGASSSLNVTIGAINTPSCWSAASPW